MLPLVNLTLSKGLRAKADDNFNEEIVNHAITYAVKGWRKVDFNPNNVEYSFSLADGDNRIYGAFNLSDGTEILFITETDLSQTSMLLSSEYKFIGQ